MRLHIPWRSAAPGDYYGIIAFAIHLALLLIVSPKFFVIFIHRIAYNFTTTKNCSLILAFRRNTSEKKIYHGANTARADVELATLRDLPRNVNFVQSNNILYSNHPITDAELALLPQIRRDQITMSSFLGSGAFGEVYEGCVTNMVAERETRVAIKTLRKGATDQEKAEFLQEAQLMSNFKHKHILRMIGVCLDFDSLYIVMELMQGGDLLSFLRQSRPPDVNVNHNFYKFPLSRQLTTNNFLLS